MAIPTNLIPVNASQLTGQLGAATGQLTSLTSQVPNLDSLDIATPDDAILSTIVPQEVFETGSVDQIRERALGTVENYINSLPLPRIIPNILTLLAIPPVPIPAFPPKVPSFGKMKNFIETKIDKIKRDRQKASVKALKEDINKQKNPFEYRKELKNKQLTSIASRVANNIRG